MTEENYNNKALWIFKNFKETVDVMPKKYRGRAWEIIINYAFGEVEEIEKENPYIQMAVKSLIPLIKLRGKGGSQSGVSNNPTGKSRANVGANVGAKVGAKVGVNVGATPLITITETETETNNNKPTKEEIEEYCQSLGKRFDDIDDFIAYYDASDWNDRAGLPINWKHAVISWISRAKRYQAEVKPKKVNMGGLF